MQTSVITTSSGISFLSARTDTCTAPLSSHADDPVASFVSGTPNKMMPPTPAFAAASASRSISSTEVWFTPGIEPTARRDGGGLVMERHQQPPLSRVVVSDLNRDPPLPCRWQPLGWVKEHGDASLDLETYEPGGGEDCRVDPATFDLAEASGHVAPQ